MHKYIQRTLMFTAAIFFTFPLFSHAKETFTNDENVIQFIQAAFHAQVSLSEEGRSLTEIDEILSPYFTEIAKDKFLEENLFEENGQYFTLGTDFPIYYIPFFNYEGETEVIRINERIYVIEFFPKNEDGPVIYDNHYEGILLEKESGNWKVADFLYDISPDDIKGQAKEIIAPVVLPKEERLSPTFIYGKSSFYLGCFMHPLTNFYRYGYSILNLFSKNL